MRADDPQSPESSGDIAADIDRLRSEATDTKSLYRSVAGLLFFKYGITPTANRLHQLVGKGSMSTAASVLARFWQELRKVSQLRLEHPGLPEPLQKIGADMLAFSAHKIYGPKGVGVLYLRKGVKVWPVIDGGSQERGIRSGTENVAGIVGMGKACELLGQRMEEDNLRIQGLRERLKRGIMEKIPYHLYTGHPEKRLPNLASFCFRYIEGEGILLSLDAWDICASSGSACTSGSLDPSHCLLAMGLPHAIAHGSLRLSLGRENTEAEVDQLVEVLPPIVQRLREMSPLYGDASRKGEV